MSPCSFRCDESLAVVALGQVVGPVHHVEAGEGQREDEARDHVDPLRLRRHLARSERTANTEIVGMNISHSKENSQER